MRQSLVAIGQATLKIRRRQYGRSASIADGATINIERIITIGP